MSNQADSKKDTKTKRTTKPAASPSERPKSEIKQQVSPLERALSLSSEQIIAQAIRDLIKRDELN